METIYGWRGKILRLNLTSGEIQHQQTAAMAERFIGGRGFLSKIYWDEVDSKKDALHPDSPVIIMTGPLAGTSAPSCNRWFIGGKSPLLNPQQFGLGNVGGSMAVAIKAAGLDGMIITGKAEKPSYVHIQDGKYKVKEAAGLWGLGIPETLKCLTAAHGKNSRAICIGPAGENQVKLAIAMSDNNACGGSGFGALMGSKNLKAIVIEGSQKVKVARPEELKKINQQVRSLIEGRVLMDPNIEGIELVKRSPCFGCPSGCPRGLYLHDSGKEEIRKNCAAAYSYYLWDKLQNNDESTAVPFLVTSLLDHYGLCGQEINNLFSFLHESDKLGLLPEGKTGIKLSEQGTLAYAEKLLDMITYRKGFGDVLAEGTIRVAQSSGKETTALLEKRVTQSGFNANAYNPRFFITNAPFYATESTSTMNQLHEVSFPMMKWTMWFATEGAYSPFSTDVLQKIAKKFWKNEKAVDFSTYDGKAEVACIIQNREYAKENLVACDFMFPITTSEGAEDHVGDPTLESRLLSAVTGINLDEKEYYRTGERIFNLQRAIQCREGRTGRKDDKINEFNFTEPIEGDPGFFDVFNPEMMLPGLGGELVSRKGSVVERDKFEKMMDEYYTIRGWDVATGLQKKETLESLGLPEIIPELKDKGLLSKE
jgi:aldehyde:ferredoxin oxidoreductase